MTSRPGTSSTSTGRQKRMGPAPFASFEDLSDEVRARLESPEDRHVAGSVVRLPGIREDLTPTTPSHMDRTPSPGAAGSHKGISLIGALSAPQSQSSSPAPGPKATIRPPCTPRIDISRASSSSHHDSRDSSPEKESIEIHDFTSAKLGLGFKEDGALELRSSTEELDFQDMTEKKRGKARPQSPAIPDDTRARKDSQCSDILLLSISGRTSRLSSIGSQGSAHSGHSRISNVSHLSALSNQSGLSRCSSPHKMLLETSFCGTKPPDVVPSIACKGTKVEQEDMEKILLSRKHDPTEAIIAEGISPPEPSTSKGKKPTKMTIDNCKIDITVTKPIVKDTTNAIVTATTTTVTASTSKISSRIVSNSGVEYIYIPLKGPLPEDLPAMKHAPSSSGKGKQKLREVKSASYQSRSPSTSHSNKQDVKPKAKSATPSPVVSKREDEPKYIRIKLKPDMSYPVEPFSQDVQKPDTLELSYKIHSCSNFVQEAPKKGPTPSNSPKLHRESNVVENVIESVTPSPSVSRRSSFASLFKSKDLTLSPDSPSLPGYKKKSSITGILKDAGDNIRTRSRSRSKSRDRDSHKSSLSTAPSSTESIDSKYGKHKSVLSLFKSSKKETVKSDTEPSGSQETLPSIEGISKVEIKLSESKRTHYENPLEAASVRIPLHSPEYYESRSIGQDWKTSSQDSQETVIEAPSKKVNLIANVDDIKPLPKSGVVNKDSRQSSTSSDNVVFSTKLDNEVFTTKLPKKLQNEKEMITQVTIEREAVKVEVNGIGNQPIQEIIVSIPQETTSPPSPPSVREGIMPSNSLVKEETTPPDLPDKETIIQLHFLAKEKTVPSSKMDENSVPPSSNQNLEGHTSQVSKETTNGERETKPSKSKSATNTTELSISEKKVPEAERVEKRISQFSEGTHSTVSSNADEDRNSSESERDVDDLKTKKELKLDLDISEPERKAIVLQQDSFEDELPYVPTTLPQERSTAIPIVPVKQRSTFEIKTCPIERPRSTTPINPSCLEEYCEEVMGSFNIENVRKSLEKLKISLPRNESFDRTKPVKSPRKKESNQNWQEFAEKNITRTSQVSETPPSAPAKPTQKAWINFEEIPEKRKAPKRIQTIPSRSFIEVPESVLQENVVYNYVNPEECKCECHEISAKERERRAQVPPQPMVQEDELPLLEEDNHDDDKNEPDNSEKVHLDVAVSDCRSIISDSSVDLSTSIDQQDNSTAEPIIRTPFTSDLGVTSNRSSIVSQDEQHSPGSPNAFPKNS